jgi:Icc protein
MTKRYLNILQITDIHFREKVDGTIYGVGTQALFEKTLEQIKNEIESSSEGVDLLLATGDISQDGTPASYQRFHDFIKPLNIPAYYLQGNHDYIQPMLNQFGEERVAPCMVIEAELAGSPWKIVLINSSVEDQVGGHFGEAELSYLRESLSSTADSPVLLCFHHHPMLINCDWLDQQVIDDADAFFKVMDDFSNVKACIYGHVHQDRLDTRNGVSYYATPSTCAQFKPETSDFELDDKAPAYRWIRCYEDGSFETEVVRLKDFSAS